MHIHIWRTGSLDQKLLGKRISIVRAMEPTSPQHIVLPPILLTSKNIRFYLILPVPNEQILTKYWNMNFDTRGINILKTFSHWLYNCCSNILRGCFFQVCNKICSLTALFNASKNHFCSRNIFLRVLQILHQCIFIPDDTWNIIKNYVLLS